MTEPGFWFGYCLGVGVVVSGGGASRAGEFSKSCKRFPWKIAKNALFSKFFKIFKNRCVTYSRVWTKTTNSRETFEKILKFSDENAIEKLNF